MNVKNTEESIIELARILADTAERANETGDGSSAELIDAIQRAILEADAETPAASLIQAAVALDATVSVLSLLTADHPVAARMSLISGALNSALVALVASTNDETASRVFDLYVPPQRQEFNVGDYCAAVAV